MKTDGTLTGLGFEYSGFRQFCGRLKEWMIYNHPWKNILDNQIVIAKFVIKKFTGALNSLLKVTCIVVKNAMANLVLF